MTGHPYLTRLELDVLTELCQTRITLSSVVLAEELESRGMVNGVGDPFGLISWTLGELNEQGLVTYREGYGGVPVEIRVTKGGFLAAGYPIRYHEVGRTFVRGPSSDEPSPHPGDPTEFRNLFSHTYGGKIERMPLSEHVVRYRAHAFIHAEQLEEMVNRDHPWSIPSVPKEEPMQSPYPANRAGRHPKGYGRTGNTPRKTTFEQDAEIIRLAGLNKTYRQIEEATGVDPQTVKNRLNPRINTDPRVQALAKAGLGPYGKGHWDGGDAQVAPKPVEPTARTPKRPGRARSTTPEQDAEITRLDNLGLSAGDIAARLRLKRQTVNDRLRRSAKLVDTRVRDEVDAEVDKERELGDTLKRAVVKVLTKVGRVEDVREVARQLSIRYPDRYRTVGAHNVQHILYVLQKDGLVSFKVHTSGQNRRLTGIEATPAGWAAVGDPLVRKVETPAKPEPWSGGPTVERIQREQAQEVAAPPLPQNEKVEPTSRTWPVLGEIQKRVAEAKDAKAKADKYLEAAAMLESIDPDQAAALLAKGEAASEAFRLSPIETEYLDYATVHPVKRVR